MTRTPTRLVWCLPFLLAACGGGAADDTPIDAAPPTADAPVTPGPPDAMPLPDGRPDAMFADAMPPPGPNLTCATVPLPTTATDPAIVTGTVNAFGVPAIAGALLEYRRRSDDTLVATTTSAADGTYVLTVPTGGVPVDGYWVVTAPGYLTTYRYFGYPISGDTSSVQRMNTQADMDAIAATAGLTIDWAQGQALVVPRDCDLQAVVGATATLAPAATAVATGAALGMCGTLMAGATTTTGCSLHELGIAPGTMTVDADLSGLMFRTQTAVKVAANSVTYVTLQPARP